MPEQTQHQAFQQRIDSIQKRYQPRIEEVKRKGEDLRRGYRPPSTQGGMAGVEFEVEWKDVDIIFDLPTVTIRDQKIVLDLPEYTTARQTISFDVPSTRMVNVKVGETPEFHGLWTIEWKPNYISVPEFYMQRVEFVYDLPSVTMRRQELVFGIPEFSMQHQSWNLKLPQFKTRNVKAELGELKTKGEQLRAEGEQIGADMKAEIDREVENYKRNMIARTLSTRSEVANSYNQALGNLKTAIDDLQSKGTDPIKIPTAQGDVNLRKKYQELVAGRDQALSEIDSALK
jgi:hypothetical protein